MRSISNNHEKETKETLKNKIMKTKGILKNKISSTDIIIYFIRDKKKILKDL